MRLRLFASLVVFVGSYLPLSLILLAQNFDYAAMGTPLCWELWEHGCHLPLRDPGPSLTVFIVCVACFLATLVTLAIVRPKHEIDITGATHVPSDLMNYTLPYIVSFMSLDYEEPGQFVGFLIFLGWVFLITHRSGQVLLNPVLIVFGWRLYDITYRHAADDVEHSARALSSGALIAGDRHCQVAVQDIVILKPAKPR